jgi:hypothetical protein
MGSFRIAINMAGAISAGAYTAGVLDFLIEALDAWYLQKDDKNKLVPRHDVMIEAFTGASAGGMCAAISAILLQDDFSHISDTESVGTSNRFYESWVNKIDIRELLKTDDLNDHSKKPDSPKAETKLVSLLDCTIIDTIADYALVRGKSLPKSRAYVSPDLTLFLSLTNLRGIAYTIDGVAPGSVEETADFYGDRIRFQTVTKESTRPLAAQAYPINVTSPEGDWSLLRDAAKATGAFPIFLAPRILSRRQSDFVPPLWQPGGPVAPETKPLQPTFPSELTDPFNTLNVDGGVTNNNPFNYAHDYLVSLEPVQSDSHLEKDPACADRAVLTIAPFPSTSAYAADYDPAANASVFRVLPRLFTALIAQSRFFGQSLGDLMSGRTFSNFIIAPSDQELAKKVTSGRKNIPEALQCASLGAFGGFFSRGFRAHDFALGRRNCQKFLRDHFLLPANNPLMKEWLDVLSRDERRRVTEAFRRPSPLCQKKGPESDLGCPPGEEERVWLPIVPLVGDAALEITSVPHYKMTRAELEEVLDLIKARFKAVAYTLINQMQGWSWLRFFLLPGPFFIALFGKKLLRQALIDQLSDSYRDE